jgi:hypothetical protein
MKILVLVIIALIPFQIVQAQKVDTAITYKVLPLDEYDVHYQNTQLDLYCEKDTTLIWDTLKASDIVFFQQEFTRFEKVLQYKTHFSNILNNYVARQIANVSLPLKNSKSSLKYFYCTVFEIQFYYPYQCDKFMQVIDKYKVEVLGHPTEEGGPVLFYANEQSIFVFIDDSGFGEWDIEKLKTVRNRVKKLLDR